MEAIRSGRVPCLENAVETLAKIQNERAVEEGLQVYQSHIFELICLPVNPSELSDIHRIAEAAAVDIFMKTSFNDTEQKAQLKLMVLCKHKAYTQIHRGIKSAQVFFFVFVLKFKISIHTQFLFLSLFPLQARDPSCVSGALQ